MTATKRKGPGGNRGRGERLTKSSVPRDPACEQAARSLLAAALHFADPPTISAIRDIPPEAWPHEDAAAFAAAVLAVADRGDHLDAAALLSELDPRPDAATLIAAISGMDPAHDATGPAKLLLERHNRAELARRAEAVRLAALDPGVPMDHLRHIVGDADMPAFVPRPSGLIVADIATAPDPPAGVFACGCYPGTLSVLASESGLGKSLLALQAVTALALGRGGVAGFQPTSQGRALYLSGEDCPGVIRQRLEAVAGREANRVLRSVDFICNPIPLFAFDRDGNVSTTTAMRDLYRLADGRDVIVVDPLSAWCPLSEENHSSGMNGIARGLETLARETGAAVLLLHHSNKAGRGESHQGVLRGSSALAAAARTIVVLSSLSDAEIASYGIAGEDAGRYVRAATVKNSYGQAAAGVLLQRDRDGVLREISRGELVEAETLRLARAMARAIGDNPDNLSQWDAIKNPAGKDIRDALKVELGNKKVTQEKLTAAYYLGIERGVITTEVYKVGGVQKTVLRGAV